MVGQLPQFIIHRLYRSGPSARTKLKMKTQSGLTLVELMVTLAVAIVLLAVGVPTYRSMVANNAIVAQTNGLVSALNLARSEAVKRGGFVAVCPKASADVAETDCGGNGDWANGWHLFTDDTGTAGDFDGTDVLLRHWEPLSGNPTVTTAAAALRFNSEGFLAAVAEQTLQLAQADAAGTQDRCIRVSVNGSVRLHKVTATATCP